MKSKASLMLICTLFGAFTFLGSAAAQPAEVTSARIAPAEITLTIDNRNATAYFVSAFDGAENLVPLDLDNATWNLALGMRYRIVNQGGGDFHPLELRSEGELLLSQQEATPGSFATDEAVAFESDGEGVTFTLTPELAEVLSGYRCAYHPAMAGSIVVN